MSTISAPAAFAMNFVLTPTLLTIIAIIFPIFLLGWSYFRVPSNYPRNIPTVPVYVSLLGLWSSMGQDEIYERWLRGPLEKHGAVKIWFAGRWSILVTKPTLLTDMFRHEDVYAKAGSQVKIPWSVIASLVGDNIINTHDNWKHFTGIMKPGMQKREWDSKLLLLDSRRLVDLFVESQARVGEKGVVVNPLIQRWAVQSMGRSFMDFDFKCLEAPSQRIEELQTIIKRTLFKPLFFNFPILDCYPWLFRSRGVAYAIMAEFGDRLFSIGRERPSKRVSPGQADSPNVQVVHLLNAALDDGEISIEQYRANMKITFLTAHENSQQLLNSTFWELGKSQDMQKRLREEVLATGTADPSAEIVNNMPYLNAVLYELLRLYPPVSQLINRLTMSDAVMGGEIAIPKGVWVGWNAYGAHVSHATWGPDAMEFKPERWGTGITEMNNKVRRDCVAGKYIPFNAHSRKCLGQGFALLEMKLVIFELIRRTSWTIAPGYELKLTPGGILAPLGCRVVFDGVR